MERSPALSSSQKLERSLRQLGFDQDTRALSVLRAMMKIQSTPPRSLDIAEIHDSLMQVEPGTALSKAWVRKVMQQLLDMQMIRVENESDSRRKYISDVDTIVAGLEQLKGQTLTDLEKHRRALKDELDRLSAINLGDLARSITGEIVSKIEQPSSKLLKGLEAYRDFTNTEIYARAGPGDVVRLAQLWLKPFTGSITERIEYILGAAERGADVRYRITAGILSANDFLTASVRKDKLVEFFVRASAQRQKGMNIDVRIHPARTPTYHFSSLNEDSMVMLLSEDPLTAMWLSRNFNPDLIQTAIASFDRTWIQSISVLDNPGQLALGVSGSESSYFLSAMKEAATKIADRGKKS
jgi:hypothetical protein